MKKFISVAIVIFVVWSFLFLPMSNAMSSEKRSDIIKLLKVSGSLAMSKKMALYAMNQVADVWQKTNKELPLRAIEILREQMSILIEEQLSDGQSYFNYFVPIYDKYYTDSEIRGLISFYESDLGRKTVKVMPHLSNELIIAGEKWGESIAPIAFDRAVKKMEAEGVKIKKN